MRRVLLILFGLAVASSAWGQSWPATTVNVSDTDGHYTGTNAETVLAEVGGKGVLTGSGAPVNGTTACHNVGARYQDTVTGAQYHCDTTGTPAGSVWTGFSGMGATTEAGLESDLTDVANVVTDNDLPLLDADVGNALTLAGGTIGTTTIALEQGAAPTPTVEGEIHWHTVNDEIVVGDGATSQTFVAGAHTAAAPVDSVHGRTGAVVAVASDYTAAEVDNTPAGDIAATTAQAALDELDAEKASSATLASTATGDGAADIGIEDAAANFAATTVEAALAELVGAATGGTTDAGAVTHVTSATDDFAVGGTTDVPGVIYFDESLGKVKADALEVRANAVDGGFVSLCEDTDVGTDCVEIAVGQTDLPAGTTTCGFDTSGKLLASCVAGGGSDADTLDTIDSTGFAILVGQATGQTLIGGTASGDDLTLETTSDVTKGSYILTELDCSAGDQYITSNASGVLACAADNSGGGATITVEEADATVDAAATVVDFGAGFDVTSSPAGEANVVLDYTEDPVDVSTAEVTGVLPSANMAATHTNDWDFKGGGIAIETAASVPGTCTEGQLFLHTVGDAGLNVHSCKGTTFTQVGLNNLEDGDPPEVLDGEIYVGRGAGSGQWAGTLTDCAANAKIDYAPGSPDMFSCETISLLDSAAFVNGSVDPIHLANQTDHKYWGAGAITPDGTNCTVPNGEVFLADGPQPLAIQCADDDGSEIEGSAAMPLDWDGGTVTFTLLIYQAASSSGAYDVDFEGQCIGQGEAFLAFNGTGEQSASATLIGGQGHTQGTSAAVTLNGTTCAAGDMLHWLGAVDATASASSIASLAWIQGVRVDYGTNPQ